MFTIKYVNFEEMIFLVVYLFLALRRRKEKRTSDSIMMGGNRVELRGNSWAWTGCCQAFIKYAQLERKPEWLIFKPN